MSTTSSVKHEAASADGASATPAYELNEELSDEHVRNHM